MMDDDDPKLKTNTWRVDDLDVGLVTGLSKLQGLGSQELMEEHPAYNMTEVLQLQLFKEEESLDSNELLQSLNNSLQESLNNDILQTLDSSLQEPLNDVLHASYTHHSPIHSGSTLNNSIQHSQININSLGNFSGGKFIMTSTGLSQMDEKHDEISIDYTITLKAPTAPGRKLDEETLTWLNQGQSYEILLQCDMKEKFLEDSFIKSTVSVGFQERQHQYFEFEKYEEWILNRPNEKMIELDVPMCWSVSPLESSCTNQIEFQWNPKNDATIYVKVNCLSSEFTKGKGESGIPLRLHIEIFGNSEASLNDDPTYIGGCQVKVFRAKGANRKLKLEREKHDSLSKEEADHVQQSLDTTVFSKLDLKDRIHRKISEATTKSEIMCGISPTQISQLKIVNSLNGKNSISATPVFSSSFPATPTCQNLSANSDVEETQNWLQFNRFHNYVKCFANFSGADLLRLSRNDLIQLCGPADGIRLNNALQARASRPLLTMYVSPEWHQSETGMREYHAMFLDQLTVADLKRKLAKKCGINEKEITALLKQGPTGIHIHVDDELVRNFVDEAHHVVEVIKDTLTGLMRILLK